MFQHRERYVLKGATVKTKNFVGRESKPCNSDFYQNDFCQCEIPNHWRTFCQILVALGQLEPLYKASIMLQNIVSMKDTIILVLVLLSYDVLP